MTGCPEHVEPSRKAIAALDRAAAAIRAAQSLEQLAHGLVAASAACLYDCFPRGARRSTKPHNMGDELRKRGIGLNALPTFGGSRPPDCGSTIWSWDHDRMLVGGRSGVLQIVLRVPFAVDIIDPDLAEVDTEYVAGMTDEGDVTIYDGWDILWSSGARRVAMHSLEEEEEQNG